MEAGLLFYGEHGYDKSLKGSVSLEEISVTVLLIYLFPITLFSGPIFSLSRSWKKVTDEER